MQILRLVSRESKKYINERDTKGLTPAMYASQNGNYECLKYLLDNANAKYNKTIKTNKYTLLHLGVRSGSLNVVQYLIMKMGTSFLKCRTKEGATVFHLAAASGNHEILEYLLATKLAKTSKFGKDLVGSTALHDAAENGMSISIFSF
jgi:ankyrin repeat protein